MVEKEETIRAEFSLLLDNSYNIQFYHLVRYYCNTELFNQHNIAILIYSNLKSLISTNTINVGIILVKYYSIVFFLLRLIVLYVISNE